MVFIPPMEISGKIMTLIEEAEKELIIVSPYVEFKNWDKLKRCLRNARDRNVAITFYVRENVKQDLDPIKEINAKIVYVKDLHAKIYLNEVNGIVSSQNLYQYSDINSIDFAYSTETEIERNQLVKLIDKYLKNSSAKIVKNEKFRESTSQNFSNEACVEKDKITGNVFPLNETDLVRIKECFKDEYTEIKIKSTSTYVYCDKLFPFADVMFREGFEIRFFFDVENKHRFIKIIQELNFENNHYKYEKKWIGKNDNSPVIIFIPQEVVDIQKLIYDYTFMAKAILDKTRNIKIQNVFY